MQPLAFPTAIALGLLAGIASSMPTLAPASNAPDEKLVWRPHDTNVTPSLDPRFERGPASYPWAGDMQHHDGRWIMGDGFGGIWHSEDGKHWHEALFITPEGDARPTQNAPVRSINISANGTMLATFLGGGRVAEAHRDETKRHQSAPVAYSRKGHIWIVVELPESCGPHFSATDGDGTWIVQGCENRLLVSEDDGRSWEAKETGIPGRIQAQGYINGVWISANTGPTDPGIYASRDLENWNRVAEIPGRIGAKRTVTTGDVAMLLGSSMYVATSRDGLQWTTRHAVEPGSRADNPLAALHHPNYGHIVGCRNGSLMYSRDLEHWHHTRIPGQLTGLVGMGVNDAGTILASGYFDGIRLYRATPTDASLPDDTARMGTGDSRVFVSHRPE